MFDCFLAQLGVLLMLFCCSARIFFLKNARIDCFAAFSPVALVFSLFLLFCFDLSILSLAVFFLALIVFFTNFRSTLRLLANLIVDGYSAAFVVFSILEIILIIMLATLIIFFRPVKYTEKSFGISKNQKTLTGNLSNLRIKENPFTGERFSGNLFVYEPVVHDEIVAELYKENPILVFAPGLRADVQNYEPYLMLLAQKGYKILSADLYVPEMNLLSQNIENPLMKRIIDSKFLRKFAAISMESAEPENFQKVLDKEKSLAAKKYSALTKLALEFFGNEAKIFYIVDGIDFDTIYSVIDEFNTEPYSNAEGFFSMNRVDEYKTSGYGFIEQNDVLLARKKGIERENKFFIPRYVASKTVQSIQEQK